MADSNDAGREVDLDAPVTPEERREAAKLIMRLFGAVLAVVVAGAVAALLTRDDNSDVAADDDDIILVGNAIGPLPGLQLGPYIDGRQKDLAEVSGRRAAVVSFSTYMKEPDARRLVEPASVDALLVAAPGGKPTVVREDLATWASRTKAEAAEERGQFEELLRGGYDPKEDKDFIEDAKLQIGRLSKLEKAADPAAAVVFGAVVVADASGLKRLATVKDIRVVDVGSEAAVPDDERIRGIRPEETVTAGDPLTRPA